MCKRIIICLVVMFSVLSFHTAIASTILEDSSQRSFLYPVCIDEQWGYIDDTGTIVITPSFYFAEPFRGSLAAVSIKTEQNQILFGIINTAGDYVVAPIWDRIESGYDGLLYGGETGFYYISDYDSGLVGYYNIGESFLCEPIYSDIFLWEYTDLLPAVKGGKMGYIDRCSGEWALEPVWDYTILDQANFSEGFALVGIMNKDDVQGILIDEQGHELSLPEGFESVTTFFEGYAIIRDTQGHYGYINTSGQCVLNPVWDYASPFSNGFAIVKKNGQSTIIDKEGTQLIKNYWNIIQDFENGYFVFRDDNNLYGYLNETGQIAIPSQYEYALSFLENGTAWIIEDNSFYLIDISGIKLYDYPLELPHLGYPNFSEGLQAVGIDGMWGFIDEQGDFVISPTYDSADNYYHNLALVYIGDQMSYINHDGVIVWSSDF